MEYVSSEKAQEIVNRWEGKSENIIEMMHDVQSDLNYLPRDVIFQISRTTNVPKSTFKNNYCR